MDTGVWYGAVAVISELIERAPNELGLRQQRAGLLGQVGLPEIAGRPEIAEEDARTQR